MLTTIFYLLVVVIVTSARDNFYDVKVEQLGQTARLFCNETYEYTLAPNYSHPISWMMPNLTIVETAFDNNRLMLTNENWTLVVANVTDTDLGLYHCMLTAENVSYFLCRAGLNAQGPYFEDLWDKYWLNTTIALSVFFGFLLMSLVLWLLWHFRYKSPEERAEDEKNENELVDPYLSAFEVALPSIAVVSDPVNGGVYPGTDVTTKKYDNAAYSTDNDTLTAF